MVDGGNPTGLERTLTKRDLWIGGHFAPGSNGVRPVINPATEESFGEVAWGGQEDAEEAVAAARAALPAWRRLPAPERTAMLHEVARRLRQHQETIAIELTLETGRSIRKNRGYVEWSAQCFDYYAELSRHERGRVIPSPEASQLSLVLKVPVGVVAAIVPWNYPLLLLAWKLAPGPGCRQHGGDQAGELYALDHARPAPCA